MDQCYQTCTKECEQWLSVYDALLQCQCPKIGCSSLIDIKHMEIEINFIESVQIDSLWEP